jgi:hypothetical protein
MSDLEASNIDAIKQRLDILIYLQLRQGDVAEMTMGKQIMLLRRLGLTNSEVAHLLGMTQGYISSEVVRQGRSKQE